MYFAQPSFCIFEWCGLKTPQPVLPYSKIANSSPDMDICRQRLAEIRCPTLIIHGSKDAMVASEHPDVLNKQIQGSKLVIFPDGKHNLHFKYKDRFNEVVEKFLLEK